ncbi:hypothetical protein [Sabulibacter ruber]|uniref:hypothetical protein n=1 Tax=Sabulibacter ruber TaxID=2811901 RepID=UPI001A961698|nr:hypothetical protein [Sabulibacter ruber]
METTTFFQMLLQVFLLLGSFTGVVFAYVVLTSGSKSALMKNAIPPIAPLRP